MTDKKKPEPSELLVSGYIKVLQRHLTKQIIPDSIALLCYLFYPTTDSLENDTLENIVISICINPVHDSIKAKAFLLCFPGFTNTMNILQIAMSRLCVNASPHSVHTNFASVQFHMMQFIEYWMDHYYPQDFALNDALHYISSVFCAKLLEQFQIDDDGELQENIHKLDKKAQNLGQHAKKQQNVKHNTDSKHSENKDNAEDIIDVEAFLDLDAKVFAEQFTLCDAKNYNRIMPREFINESWKMRVNQGRDAPNILKFIQYSNQLSYWMQFVILSAKDLKQRKKVLMQCIAISKHFKQMSNFNGMWMMNGCFESTPIYRLKALWSILPAKITKIKNEISVACSNTNMNLTNEIYHNMKTKIATIPPLILFLQDVSWIYDRLQLNTFDGKPEEQIHYAAYMRIYELIHHKIMKFKECTYAFKEDERYQQMIQNIQRNGFSDEQMYQLSVKVKIQDTTEQTQSKLSIASFWKKK